MTGHAPGSSPASRGAGAPEAFLLTPPGKGGIAVIALRGAHVGQVLRRVFRPLTGHADPGAGRLQLGRVVAGGQVIDEAILRWAADWAELNIHGGPQAAKAALEALAAAGADVAPAGGASRAGFEPAHPHWANPAVGREMLEAISTVSGILAVSAVTWQWSDGISRLASEALAGGLGREEWAGRSTRLRKAAAGLAVMRRLLRPAEVVLAGPPNVGKSTLANALVGRPVSIVHQTPGTTRDWVRELALLEGLPVWVTDTAGIWTATEAGGPPAATPDLETQVDQEAVRRARLRVRQADLVLLLDCRARRPADPARRPAWCRAAKAISVWTKLDLGPPRGAHDLAVSARSSAGLGELRRAILSALGLEDFQPTVPRAFTPRQAELLSAAADATDLGLEKARTALVTLLEG